MKVIRGVDEDGDGFIDMKVQTNFDRPQYDYFLIDSLVSMHYFVSYRFCIFCYLILPLWNVCCHVAVCVLLLLCVSLRVFDVHFLYLQELESSMKDIDFLGVPCSPWRFYVDPAQVRLYAAPSMPAAL